MSKATIVCMGVFAAACATGGSGSGSNEQADAAVVVQDAAHVTTPDALVRADAGVGQDAQVSQLPDASTGGGGGLFCASNSACTVSGECCVTLGGPQGFCAPGTVVLGQCVPE